MSQFNYETYAEAIKGLALLPAELQQSQQKAEALFLNQKSKLKLQRNRNSTNWKRLRRLLFNNLMMLRVSIRFCFRCRYPDRDLYQLRFR